MANRSKQGARRANEHLSMKIYSALLGGLPRIQRNERQPLGSEDTPFHASTLSRQLRRATGQASRALDEARERISRAKTAAASRPAKEAPTMVLIGPAGAKRRRVASTTIASTPIAA